MPRAVVVLPSTTYRARDFVLAAESLGIDLVVASEQPPPFDMGNRYLQIDCGNPQQAAEQVAALGDDVPLDGLVAADDGGVLVVALAGNTLGLRANPVEAASATRNKHLMRDRLAAAEVLQPNYAVAATADDIAKAVSHVGFPLVLKPLDRSASQGVIRVDSHTHLMASVERVRKIIKDDSGTVPLMFEAYVPGEEVAVEGLVSDGELTVLAILDKPDTGTGPFFPETIMITPSRLADRDRDECVRVAQAAITGLGLTHGPVHVEIRVDDGRASVIEVAARSIGGLCSRSLNFGLMGTTLETLILRNAIGMDKPELRRESEASGVLMIPIPRSGRLKEVDGLDQCRAIPGVTGVEMTLKPGAELLAPPEGDRYLGFVFASGVTPDLVEEALRKAQATITVELIDPDPDPHYEAQLEG